MSNKYFIVLSMIFLFFMGGTYGCFHGVKRDRTTINVNFIDFAPEDGNYDLNWPGPPRRAWTESDKEYYKATIELSAPAPETFSLGFYVKEWGFWSDEELGFFLATFNQGDTRSQPRFWLVCTKRGNVKGDIGKDDQNAEVFLKSSGLASDINLDTWTWNITATRYYHDVNCR